MNLESPTEKKETELSPEQLEKFYPGKSSEGGFLASEEDLNKVISRDRATCERFGIPPKQIGETIEQILRGEKKDIFEVKIQTWRGMQSCPFESSFKFLPFSNIDFTITNKETGTSFTGPGLIVHLLKAHDFFEGNTPYRVDPERAIGVLFDK